MNKDEILKKSRKENEFLDERQQQKIKNGFGFGGVIVAILCVIFSVLKALNGEHFFEFGAIIFGYLSGTAWYNYRATKKRIYLMQAITCSIGFAVNFIAFFWID